MTTARQIVGSAMVVILIPAAVWGQAGTATNPPPAPVTMPDASSATNPPAAVPVTVPQAVEPQPAVPKPAHVEVPLATAPSTGTSEPQATVRAMPLALPTTQELLSKSMQSAPGGSQDKLNAIASAQLALSPTNTSPSLSSAPAEPLTNAAVSQSTNIWESNNPLLNGVQYHW